MRLAHGGLDDVRAFVEPDERHADTELEPYTDFSADLARVTLGRGDPDMAAILVGDSATPWGGSRGGIRFRLMYERQANEVDGAWASGAGSRWASWTAAAGWSTSRRPRRRGPASRSVTTPRSGCAVEGGVVVRGETLRARSIILAAGGFESNPQMRATYLGPNWDVAKVRGTPYNTGEVLRSALELGAAPYGHWSGCHAIQWDAARRRSAIWRSPTASRASPIPSESS